MPNVGKRPEPAEILGQLIFGKCVTMAVSSPPSCGIADKLAAGPKSAADLAKETNTHGPTPLSRAAGAGRVRHLLRTRRRPFSHDADRRIAPLRRARLDAGHGRLLRRDGAGSRGAI